MYQNKYLKYKKKYLDLKNQIAGSDADNERELIYQNELTFHGNYFTQKILDDLYFTLVPLNIRNHPSWDKINEQLYKQRLEIYKGEDKSLKDKLGYVGFRIVINVINIIKNNTPADYRFWCGILSKVPLIFNSNFDFNEIVFNNSQMFITGTHSLIQLFSSHMGIYRNPGYDIDNDGNLTNNKRHRNVSILLHNLVATSIKQYQEINGGVELKYMITNPISVMRLLLMKYIYKIPSDILLNYFKKNTYEQYEFDRKIIKEKYNIEYEWNRRQGILKENEIEIVNLYRLPSSYDHPILVISSTGERNILVFKLSDIINMRYRYVDDKFEYF
jgi:hypothetical protein